MFLGELLRWMESETDKQRQKDRDYTKEEIEQTATEKKRKKDGERTKRGRA